MLADLSARFPANELRGMVALEKVLVQAALGKSLNDVCESQFLGEDVNQDTFLSQLRTLKSLRFQGNSFLKVSKAITLLLRLPQRERFRRSEESSPGTEPPWISTSNKLPNHCRD